MNDNSKNKKRMMTSSLITLEQIGLTLKSPAGEVPILQGINLKIQEAETVSIVGASGSGKTSLLMVIAGIEKATQGRLWIDGKDITHYSEDQLAILRRHYMGIVFQNFHLIPTMSALENVAVPLELAGRKDAFLHASAMLEKVGLGRRKTHLPAQLSGGEQQRVALARAFVMQPRVLLADEPTGNLDHENGAHIMELMFELHRAYGTTLILVTHDSGLAKKCGRTVQIYDGKIVEAPLVEASS